MLRRQFLNRPGHNSVAAIFATVDAEEKFSQLILSDCNHSVDFDVSIYNASDRGNTLFKIDTMLRVLKEFRAAVADIDRS